MRGKIKIQIKNRHITFNFTLDDELHVKVKDYAEPKLMVGRTA